MLRLWRNLLGERGCGVGPHGAGQSARPCRRRGRLHRLSGYVLPDAPAGLCASCWNAAALHSYRADPQRRLSLSDAMSPETHEPVDHAAAAARFIADAPHLAFHDTRLWELRQKRDGQMHGVPEWETLRDLASAIKEHTLSRLAEYLEQ